MSKTTKTYHINQSPLYKLKSKKKLFTLLGIKPKQLSSLLSNPDNYREFSKPDKNSGKIRHYEVPKERLEFLHRRLFNLLSKITSPSYLQSGTKGRSHISNAKMHVGCNELISLDIKNFYPSTKGWHVYDFFHNVLLCSPDVSAILKDISTHNDHVPTGSCLSQKIAFFAHYEMFNEIDNLSDKFNLIFSCFVDDLNLSGSFTSKFHLNKVRVILKNRGLLSHPKKERVYKNTGFKEITGSIVTKDGLQLPNKKHKNIHEIVQKISMTEDSETKLKELISVKGKALAALQVDPCSVKRFNALTCEVNRLTKKLGAK